MNFHSFLIRTAILATCVTSQNTSSLIDQWTDPPQPPPPPPPPPPQQQQQQQRPRHDYSTTSLFSNKAINTNKTDGDIISEDGSFSIASVTTSDDVMKSHSLPDAEAFHGKLFEYEIPRADVNGRRRISTYQVYAGESQDLPEWLLWNSLTSTLEGIPTRDVVGTKYSMLIISQLDPVEVTSRASSNKMIWHFSITVSQITYGSPARDNRDRNDSTNDADGTGGANWRKDVRPKSTVECTRPGSSVTKAIVVIDADPAELSTAAKIRLLRQTARHLKLDRFSLIVRTVDDLESLSTAALVAGSGNVKRGKNHRNLKEEEEEEEEEEGGKSDSLSRYLSIQWVVGCGDVQAGHMEVLVDLERTTSDGRLSDSIGGRGIAAWYVVNNKPPRSKRSPSGRHKYGHQYRGGKQFDVDLSSNGAMDIYAASGDGSLLPGAENETRGTIPQIAIASTAKPKPHKQSKKPKTKKPKYSPPLAHSPTPHPTIDVYAGRPFFYDLSSESIFSDGAKDYGISTESSDSLPPDHWIKINTSSPLLYGFPMKEAAGEHVFKLSTMTKAGVATKSYKVNVLDDFSTSLPNHQFCLTLDLEYNRLIYDVELRIEVAMRLNQAFRSGDPGEMTVLGISGGSVVYNWFNNTLPKSYCDEDGLLALMNGFVDQDGTIKDDFKRALEPYRIINASVSTFGPCSHISPRPRIGGDKTSDSGVIKDRIGSDKLFYMIIGFIVAAAVVLVVVFVALLLLLRYKRKQKREKQKQLFKSGMPTKGVPVIFAEELQAAEKDEDKKSQKDDGHQDTARSTLRSRKGSDEVNPNHDKKTVPPPEYQPPRSGNRDAVLRNDMDPILEGFASSAKTPLYNNDGNVFDGVMDLHGDDNHNIFLSNKNGNFKRVDPRVRHENRKIQQMIVSDID